MNTGLKQGCILSPLLFNVFINNLTSAINTLGCGIQCGNIVVSMLMYADDIVMLSDTEFKLQSMLNCLSDWCNEWGLHINCNKSKVIHFRPQRITKTDTQFMCGEYLLETVSQYKYLGVYLTEHLDFSVMTKIVSQSASRALGLLISKDKSFGGMPFNCFMRCYDACVQATINYSAAIWGTRSFSCINAVQNRACRYFLGLGKYAPNVANNGDMGWTTPEHKQWMCVIRIWCRLINMAPHLLTKCIFVEYLEASSYRCKTWFYRVKTFLNEIGFENIYNSQRLVVRNVLGMIDTTLHTYYQRVWSEKLNSDVAVRGATAGGNKLRTYRQFKTTYATEQYVSIITHKKYRSAYAKFRCGVAPLKIETGRYGLNRVPVHERLCERCNIIEDEYHVIMQCSNYEDIRYDMFTELCNIDIGFNTITNQQQFIQIMSNPHFYKVVSKAMYSILNIKRCLMCK